MNNLKKITNDISILYIEKDKELQIKISNHLKQVFTNVYQSYDGLDGMKQYIKNKPKIVILDLSLDKMDAIELIVNMQDIDPKLNIIVISEDNDNYRLLQTLDMGLSEIILKPVNLNKLNSTIEKILTKIVPKTVEKTIDKSCFLELKKHINIKIDFINTYKGILLQNSGVIEYCEENMFKVKVSKTQLIAAQYEKFTILKLSKTNKHIYAFILNVDLRNKILTLVKPKFIDYKQRSKLFSRIIVDKSFKASMFFTNHIIELDIKYISYKSTVLFTNDKNINLKVNDELDLTLGFDLGSPSSLIKEKKFTKIFSKAKVIRIKPYKSGINIIVLLDVQKAGQNTFKKYLQNREMEIIHEFKNRLRA